MSQYNTAPDLGESLADMQRRLAALEAQLARAGGALLSTVPVVGGNKTAYGIGVFVGSGAATQNVTQAHGLAAAPAFYIASPLGWIGWSVQQAANATNLTISMAASAGVFTAATNFFYTWMAVL